VELSVADTAPSTQQLPAKQPRFVTSPPKEETHSEKAQNLNLFGNYTLKPKQPSQINLSS
jgi:hypothetical protein